mgnify:CR=1 FL=1
MNEEYQECFIPSTTYKQISLEECAGFDRDVFYKLWLTVDITYKILLDHISFMRGFDASELEVITQNKTFTGKEALDIGLVDEIGTIEDAISFLEEELDEDLQPIYLTKIFEMQQGAAIG